MGTDGLLTLRQHSWLALPGIQGQITGGYLAPHPLGAPTQILATLGIQIPASRYLKFRTPH